VRRVVGAGAQPHEPRPRRRRGLAVAQHPQRLVGDVLGEVVALFGLARLLDRVVVLDQRRIPLVGLAAEEPVEAVKALRERPVGLRSAGVALLGGDVVVLADPVGVVAVAAQDLGDRRGLARQMRVRARVAGGALDTSAFRAMTWSDIVGGRREAQNAARCLFMAARAVGSPPSVTSTRRCASRGLTDDERPAMLSEDTSWPPLPPQGPRYGWSLRKP